MQTGDKIYTLNAQHFSMPELNVLKAWKYEIWINLIVHNNGNDSCAILAKKLYPTPSADPANIRAAFAWSRILLAGFKFSFRKQSSAS